MNSLKWLFCFLFSLGLLLTFLWSSIEIPAYDKNFYLEQYEKNNTYDVIGISREDLSRVTERIIDYLQLETDGLNLGVQINGQPRDFYSGKELEHMADVQNLFRAFKILRSACFVMILISFVFIMRTEGGGRALAISTSAVFIGFFLISLILALIISTDFNRYFTVFHEIFFTNDLWILDPNVDLLINIVPLPFFISIALYAASVFAVFSVIIIAVCLASLRPKGGLHALSSDSSSDS